MSGLLGRLATRALGIAPVAEPIVAPLFAPGPNLGHFEAAGERPYALARPFKEPETRQSTLPSTQARSVETTPFQTGLFTPVSRSLSDKPFADVNDSPPREDRGLIALPKAVERSSNLLGAQVRAEATDREALALKSERPQPEQRGNLRESVFAEAPSPPVIRISIGRIDVRAEMPTAAPPIAAKQRPSAMSLDEYAKLRAEGKR